jgi:glycine/D-amino acid oxidase-like deaminating enzyme
MFKVGGFVAGHQIDNARPKPRWSVESFGAIPAKIGSPFLPCLVVHLRGVGMADDRCEKTRRRNGFLAGELIHLQLKKQKELVVWESARPYLYVRTTVDGKIVAGGEDVDFVNAEKRDRLLPSKTRTLVKKIRKMFPHVSWKLATAWTGTFGESKDGLPYIGPHKDFPGAQFALGYGGNGITFAVIASAIIPDLISGTKNPDAKLFRFGRKSG